MPTDDSTPAPTSTLFFPTADPTARTATFPPVRTVTPPTPDANGSIPPTPVGPLTADLVDLGDGVKEFVFSSDWADEKGGDHTEVAVMLSDTAGQVHILAERMCSDCYQFASERHPAAFWEVHAVLSELGSESATFSVVAERKADPRALFDIIRTNPGASYRQWKVLDFQKELLATTSPDVVKLLDQASKSWPVNTPPQDAGWASGVLSEDAEARWGETYLAFDGLPVTSAEAEPVFEAGGPGPLDLGSAFSVGGKTALRVMWMYGLRDCGGKYGCGTDYTKPTKLIWLAERTSKTWRELSAPGSYPTFPEENEYNFWRFLNRKWLYRDAWYSARWKAHFAWVGNATGRMFMREDK